MIPRFVSVLVVVFVLAVMSSLANAQGRLEPVGPITWHRLKTLPDVRYFKDGRGNGYWPNGTPMTTSDVRNIIARSNAATREVLDISRENGARMDDWARRQRWRNESEERNRRRWHYVNTGQDWVEVIHH